MYSKSRNIVIGFHGCDKSVRDAIVAGKSFMKRSDNDFDHLILFEVYFGKVKIYTPMLVSKKRTIFKSVFVILIV
jgi:hypothetical protein